MVSKTATVFSNDPLKPQVNITLSAKVNQFATYPKKIDLYGMVGNQISKTVEIIPNEKFPFTIESSKVHPGTSISAKVDSNDKGYLITVTNTRTAPGRYWEKLILKTNSKIKPEITIPVYGTLSAKK